MYQISSDYSRLGLLNGLFNFLCRRPKVFTLLTRTNEVMAHLPQRCRVLTSLGTICCFIMFKESTLNYPILV